MSKRQEAVWTNNFALDALQVGLLYKSRWQVELFFKWIKQNLRIKAFVGNSPNAVKTQIWIAISTYVMVAIIKKSSTRSLTTRDLASPEREICSIKNLSN